MYHTTHTHTLWSLTPLWLLTCYGFSTLWLLMRASCFSVCWFVCLCQEDGLKIGRRARWSELNDEEREKRNRNVSYSMPSVAKCAQPATCGHNTPLPFILLYPLTCFPPQDVEWKRHERRGADKACGNGKGLGGGGVQSKVCQTEPQIVRTSH